MSDTRDYVNYIHLHVWGIPYTHPYSLAGQYPRELSVRVAVDEVATRESIEVPASKKAS